MRIFFITLLFVLAIMSLDAQTDSIRTHTIDEVEVTATAKPSTFQSGTLLQVFTDKDLDRIGVQSVADAVRRFSGVAVKDYGGLGGLKTVSIRGLGAQHTAVSYDGITLNEAQSGQVDIGRFSLDNISMLMLYIGQSDDIFLSARHFASAGVLNIKTSTPRFVSKSYEARVNIKTGSFGLFNPSAYFAKKINSVWSASINGEWQRADGYYPYYYESGNTKEKRKRYNSDVNIWRTELNVYGDFRNAGKLRLKAYYFDSERGIPAIPDRFNTYTGERLWDKEFISQANYENKINSKFSVQGLAKFYWLQNRYNNITHDAKDNILKDKYLQWEYYISGSLLYTPAEHFSFSLAQDFFHNKIDMNFPRSGLSDSEAVENEKYPITNDAYRNTSLTVVSGQFKNKYVTVTSSLLGTYVDEHVKKGESPNARKRLSPSVSFSYKPFPIGLRIRGSYKDIYRLPTFNDEYYSRMGSRKLKSETTKQYNAGLTWVTNLNPVFNYLSLSIDGYINKIDNKIVLEGGTAASWTMINLNKETTIKGVDVTLSSDITFAKQIKLTVSGNYSYMKAENDLVKVIPYTPEHIGNFSISLENPYINISYNFVASSKRYAKTIKSKIYCIDPYFDHNISANKTFQWDQHKLRLQGELLNMNNDNYEIIYKYPMPGRSFRISASWIF